MCYGRLVLVRPVLDVAVRYGLLGFCLVWQARLVIVRWVGLW